jgi:hypothetical protein
MSGVTQVVLAAVIIVALVCATVLVMNGHVWAPVAMVLFAMAGLFVIGGVEVGRRKREGGGE